MTSHSRLDLPGTYVFDGPTSRRGYNMNKLFMSLRAPTYRLVTRSGPDHSPRFTVAVDVESHQAAEGEGRETQRAGGAGAPLEPPAVVGGGGRTRTSDTGLMRPLLCHLSYAALVGTSRSCRAEF